jgi:hypothetical protein
MNSTISCNVASQWRTASSGVALISVHQLHGAQQLLAQILYPPRSPVLDLYQEPTSPIIRLRTSPLFPSHLHKMRPTRIQTRPVGFVSLVQRMVSSCLLLNRLMIGRLISPCRCRGTMKFVHLSCLNSWRYTSPNAKSVYQCDQCGYKYNFNRTQYAAIIGSLYTCVFFISCNI